MERSPTCEATYQVILDGADRILARYGFRKMSMEDLAKEVRISRRTLYLHFKNKEDVGLSSIERTVSRVHDQLCAIANEDIAVTERLRKILRTRVMARIEATKPFHEGLDQLFEVVRPGYLARRQKMFERESEILAAVIEEGMRGGLFRSGSPLEAAEACLLATNAFLPYGLSVAELGRPDDIERRLHSMIELLIGGLTHP